MLWLILFGTPPFLISALVKRNRALHCLPAPTVLAHFSIAIAPATSLPTNQACNAFVIIVCSCLPIQTMPNPPEYFCITSLRYHLPCLSVCLACLCYASGIAPQNMTTGDEPPKCNIFTFTLDVSHGLSSSCLS